MIGRSGDRVVWVARLDDRVVARSGDRWSVEKNGMEQAFRPAVKVEKTRALAPEVMCAFSMSLIRF